MIKIIVTFTKLVISVLFTLMMASCVFTGTSGDGNVTTKSRNVSGDFTKVAVNRGLDVVVIQSDSPSISVEADSNLHEHITTSIENGVLRISTNSSIANAEVLKITVHLPVISGLETSGGSTITSENVLLSEAMTLSASSGSEIDVELESDKTIAEASSGSQITLRGKALSFEVSSSSGSEVDARKLLANDIIAQANSGRSISSSNCS